MTGLPGKQKGPFKGFFFDKTFDPSLTLPMLIIKRNSFQNFVFIIQRNVLSRPLKMGRMIVHAIAINGTSKF